MTQQRQITKLFGTEIIVTSVKPSDWPCTQTELNGFNEAAQRGDVPTLEQQEQGEEVKREQWEKYLPENHKPHPL